MECACPLALFHNSQIQQTHENKILFLGGCDSRLRSNGSDRAEPIQKQTANC
jgi:hypothetical protein